jgi:Protein of unknown function (DUF1524)/Excalibur calcium-binding domain
MATTDEPDSGSGSRQADDNVQYEFKSVHALRGRERRAKAKWHDQGWEFVSENRGTLRTELNFRRVKPKTFGAHLLSFVATFRRLRPKTQVLVASGALILVPGIIGIVAGTQGGGDKPNPSAAQADSGYDRPSTATQASRPNAERASSHQREERSEAKAVARTGTAAAALAALPVKGRAPKTGYDRDEFGSGWASVDGCEIRDRMLARDLTTKVYVDDCRIESGKVNDPYTAARITYVRGGASEVDIDHVVALGDAWQKGAQQWSYARRVSFANDPLNLLSVDASANRQKSDGDAATWLPPNKRFRCKYVSRQVAVKTKYEAWVTQAEHDAIARVLTTCPGQQLPKSGRARVRVRPTHTVPASAPTATPEPAEPKGGSGEAQYFENCDAVSAAGLAPLVRGDGIYGQNTHMDRDGDGVACE